MFSNQDQNIHNQKEILFPIPLFFCIPHGKQKKHAEIARKNLDFVARFNHTSIAEIEQVVHTKTDSNINGWIGYYQMYSNDHHPDEENNNIAIKKQCPHCRNPTLEYEEIKMGPFVKLRVTCKEKDPICPICMNKELTYKNPNHSIKMKCCHFMMCKNCFDKIKTS